MSSWIHVDTFVGGVAGGDGAGEATSLRFNHREDPFRAIEVALYAVDERDRGRDDLDEYPWAVEEQFSILVLDDEGEIYDATDHEYQMPDTGFATEAEAEEARDAMVGNWQRNFDLYLP